MFDTVLVEQAKNILQRCKAKGFMISTAESCTGGMLGALFTEIPGSSAAYEGGVVSYSNTMKQHLLGVPEDVLHTKGAVSPEVAEHMARGMQTKAGSDIAISVTGIAGPDGGTPEKPVGLVYIGLMTGSHVKVEECHFSGDRSSIRQQTVARCLQLLSEAL